MQGRNTKVAVVLIQKKTPLPPGTRKLCMFAVISLFRRPDGLSWLSFVTLSAVLSIMSSPYIKCIVAAGRCTERKSAQGS